MNKKKVLVCDDDEGILDMLSMALETEDLVVLTEANSLNVMPLIQQERPDLVLLDLWMPVLSGDQILREIRKMPEMSNLPVVIISASMEGARIAKENGADEFIAKPFDLDVLLNRICGIIDIGC